MVVISRNLTKSITLHTSLLSEARELPASMFYVPRASVLGLNVLFMSRTFIAMQRYKYLDTESL